MKKYKIILHCERFSTIVEAENKVDALNKAAAQLKNWDRESSIEVLDPNTYEIEEIE
jgi:hypothetical protein